MAKQTLDMKPSMNKKKLLQKNKTKQQQQKKRAPQAGASYARGK